MLTLRAGAAPAAVGLNLTEMLQLSVGWSVVAEQVSALTANMPAGSATVPTAASASPLLVTVIVCGALVVPTAVSGNAIAFDAGVMSITAWVPVPVSATVCGEPGAPEYATLSVRAGAAP